MIARSATADLTLEVPQAGKGRSARASLFFASLAAAALLAYSLWPAVSGLGWSGIVALCLAFGCAPSQRLPVNALTVAVAALCAWLFIDAAFLTPRYSADSLYRPLVLFGGFSVAAALGSDARKQLWRMATALVVALVLLGLLQSWLGFWTPEPSTRRASATFVTANTFATVINLLLLPLLALAVHGRGGRTVYAVAFWCFAGLLATESRGGWLAFLAGLVCIRTYQGRSLQAEDRVRWMKVAAGLLCTVMAYYALKTVASVFPSGGEEVFSSLGRVMADDVVARGTSYRLDLAAVALEQISQRPLLGAGANMFWPLYEMAKPPALDIGATFPFAHNDYLQTWMEFGLPGIVLLCAVVAAAFTLVLKNRRDQEDPWISCAFGAAAAGVFCHAAVDFPLYVPFPLLLTGAWMGALASSRGDAPWASGAVAGVLTRLQAVQVRLLPRVLAFTVLAWLAQPMLGEFSAKHALSELFAGRTQEGVYWQTVARRLEPRSGRRCWEEGVIWRDLAVETAGKDFAANADAAFARGMQADPYDVNNFVERARLHREHRGLLAAPATPEEILRWSEHVAALRPYVLAGQAEYARSLAFAGRLEDARRLARAMAGQHPGSPVVRRLEAEL